MRPSPLAPACALLVALACGSGEGPGDAGRAAPPPAAAAEAPPSPASEPALAAAGVLDCPEGTRLFERTLSAIETELRWCERPGADGRTVQHGPYEKRRAGRVAERGGYAEGQREGEWAVYWPSGELQSQGVYRADRRAGLWSFHAPSGELLRRVDYSAEEPASAAEAEPAPARGAAGPAPLRFENAGSETLRVELGSGDVWELEPGESVRFFLSPPPGDDIRIESGVEGLRVVAGETPPRADAATGRSPDGR